MDGRTTRALVLALAVSAAPRVAQAEPARMVAVVLVADDGEAELAERVEGQTSDLELALVIERRGPGATGSGPELSEAAGIAGRHRARVVVWFARDASSWLVHVAEPAEDREFVRRVAARGDLASSATAEGVALVVRGSLRALAAGGTIGVAGPPPPRDQRRAFAALGWRGVTGAGPAIHHGVAARAGYGFGRWHTDLATTFYPRVALTSENTTIDLERWSFAAGFGVELGAAPAADGVGWRAGFAIDAGATRFSRVTTSAGELLSPTPPETTWSATAAARARVARRVSGRLWLELAAGVEFLLRAPEFGVSNGGTFVIHTRLRPVEPFGVLGLVIDFG
jgi:hypothetical protein